MAYSVSEYLQLLLDLLPTGKAWSRNPEGKLYQLMYGFAAELNRIDVRSDELRVELDTRYTNELLIDHETQTIEIVCLIVFIVLCMKKFFLFFFLRMKINHMLMYVYNLMIIQLVIYKLN